jgi:hypothetical protein
MRKPRPSTLAWGGIAAGVAAYDVLAPKGETLSERCDSALERPLGRSFVYAAVGITALHLCNLIPEELDPIHHALKWKK